MAKNTTKKIKELKSDKPEKISNEELNKVQSIINDINRAQLDLGMLETRKHQMLHGIMTVQDQLTIMQGEFEKDYGTYDVDIQTGAINYKEDVEADKKD